jgi:hypothetical protein
MRNKPRGAVLQRIRLRLRLLYIRQDLRAASEIAFPGLGQMQPPRAAVQEPHPEPPLQRAHVVPGHLRRYAEMPRGGGEAAEFDRPLKDGHAANRSMAGNPGERRIVAYQCWP